MTGLRVPDREATCTNWPGRIRAAIGGARQVWRRRPGRTSLVSRSRDSALLRPGVGPDPRPPDGRPIPLSAGSGPGVVELRCDLRMALREGFGQVAEEVGGVVELDHVVRRGEGL